MKKYITKTGVTLVELIVVMAIVSILAIISFPAYNSYMINSRRSDAINELLKQQLIVEQYIAQNGFAPATNELPLNTISPKGYYNISYTWLGADFYILSAQSRIDGPQINDNDCLNIYIYANTLGIQPKICR